MRGRRHSILPLPYLLALLVTKTISIEPHLPYLIPNNLVLQVGIWDRKEGMNEGRKDQHYRASCRDELNLASQIQLINLNIIATRGYAYLAFTYVHAPVLLITLYLTALPYLV